MAPKLYVQPLNAPPLIVPPGLLSTSPLLNVPPLIVPGVIQQGVLKRAAGDGAVVDHVDGHGVVPRVERAAGGDFEFGERIRRERQRRERVRVLAAGRDFG